MEKKLLNKHSEAVQRGDLCDVDVLRFMWLLGHWKAKDPSVWDQQGCKNAKNRGGLKMQHYLGLNGDLWCPTSAPRTPESRVSGRDPSGGFRQMRYSVPGAETSASSSPYVVEASSHP